jgi:hypothetical protein
MFDNLWDKIERRDQSDNDGMGDDVVIHAVYFSSSSPDF